MKTKPKHFNGGGLLILRGLKVGEDRVISRSGYQKARRAALALGWQISTRRTFDEPGLIRIWRDK